MNLCHEFGTKHYHEFSHSDTQKSVTDLKVHKRSNNAALKARVIWHNHIGTSNFAARCRHAAEIGHELRVTWPRGNAIIALSRARGRRKNINYFHSNLRIHVEQAVNSVKLTPALVYASGP
jgi:hypothetical protein